MLCEKCGQPLKQGYLYSETRAGIAVTVCRNCFSQLIGWGICSQCGIAFLHQGEIPWNPNRCQKCPGSGRNTATSKRSKAEQERADRRSKGAFTYRDRTKSDARLPPLVVEGAFPGTILVDTREHSAGFSYDFSLLWPGLCVTPAVLAVGDYSLLGKTGRVAVEVKSLADFFACAFGNRSDDFLAQLARLGDVDCGHIVVEASWERIMDRSAMTRRRDRDHIVASLQHRYPRVTWSFHDDEHAAAIATLAILATTARKFSTA